MNRNPLKALLEGAGFGHFPLARIAAALLTALMLLGLSVTKVTGVLGIGVASMILAGAAVVEALKALRAARSQALVSALPEVAEATAAGVAAGEELGETLCRFAEAGPKPLRSSFVKFRELLNRGYNLEQSLAWLQLELADENADLLIQFLIQSQRLGGAGLVANLNNLAKVIREQAALNAELAAKQGWVIGTAKLGIASPWLIVLFLNQRPEAHNFYASTDGSAVLLTGLLVCAVAYALIVRLSRLPQTRRVLNAVL